MIRVLALIAMAIALFTVIPAVHADDEPPLSDLDKEFLASATKYVDSLEMRMKAGDELVERIEKPVYFYRQPQQDTPHGALFAWGRTGRPRAFLEYISLRGAGPQLVLALTMTTTDLFTLKTPEESNWKPQKSQIVPWAVPDAPAPAADENDRTAQIKELTGKLKSHEFWFPMNSKYLLTVRKDPVLRYIDEAAGVRDGAAVLILNGANPEVILLVEAIGPTLAEARWHYSFARIGSAELHVQLKGDDIWHCEAAMPPTGDPDGPYWAYLK